MEREKKRFASERALLLVAGGVMLPLYFFTGFELTVLVFLSFIAGHVMKISLRYPDS